MYIIMDKSLSTSGPSTANPLTLNCTGCVIKYSFLGYNDNAGSSSISGSVPIAPGLNNQLTNLTPTDITSFEKNNLWVPLTDSLGNIVAEIDANGNNLGNITGTMYKNNGAIRATSGGTPYLDRSITITVQTQPSSPVNVRLYLTAAELAALVAAPGSGVANINSVSVHKNNDANGIALTAAPTAITPSRASFGSNYVVTASVSNFSTFYFAGSSVVLPVDILTFNGTLQPDLSALLTWKTENEINLLHFIVEKSTDGKTFTAIGTVAAGLPNTTIKNYSFTDITLSDLVTPAVFYRLKIVDVNGTYKYSSIVKVLMPPAKGTITIAPNPVINKIKANTVSPADCKAEWRIIDQTGRIMQSGNTLLKKGNNIVTISTGNLAAGTYYLHITGSCIDSKTKFQKL